MEQGDNREKFDQYCSGAAAGVTTWARPEDGHIKRLADGEYAFITTITGTNSVITVRLNDTAPSVVNFATPNTIDLATGLAAGGTFSSADNIEFDAWGRAYILEDLEPNGGAFGPRLTPTTTVSPRAWAAGQAC